MPRGKQQDAGPAIRGLAKLTAEIPDSWLARFIVGALELVEESGTGVVSRGSAMLAEDFVTEYNRAGEENRRMLALMGGTGAPMVLRDYAAMPTLTMDGCHARS